MLVGDLQLGFHQHFDCCCRHHSVPSCATFTKVHYHMTFMRPANSLSHRNVHWNVRILSPKNKNLFHPQQACPVQLSMPCHRPITPFCRPGAVEVIDLCEWPKKRKQTSKWQIVGSLVGTVVHFWHMSWHLCHACQGSHLISQAMLQEKLDASILGRLMAEERLEELKFGPQLTTGQQTVDQFVLANFELNVDKPKLKCHSFLMVVFICIYMLT